MTKAKQKVRIVVDAMGGDYAPSEIVKGAVLAAKKDDVDITLVGPTDTIAAELAKYNSSYPPLRCIGADEFIKEDESLAISARPRPNTSIAVSAKTVKAREAEAMVSAGPTKVLVANVLRYLGTIDGIERPVIGGALATFAPNTVLMDCGANVDCKPYHLVTFAIMGTIYAKKFLNIDNPTVGLLNVGTEDNKGNALVRESYHLLKKSGLNFIGNVEGNGILTGQANVIVCDGFTGNILFKLCEGGFSVINTWLKKKLKPFPLPGLFKLLSKDLSSLTNMPESAGSHLIWGVDGIALKMHGASRAREVAEKITQAKLVVDMDVIGSLKSELASIKSTLNF